VSVPGALLLVSTSLGRTALRASDPQVDPGDALVDTRDALVDPGCA
jgi:hypothetical protein